MRFLTHVGGVALPDERSIFFQIILKGI